MADQTPTTGYGKRPLWQWILIYVVIAIVVYGLIYYFVFARNGGYNASTASYPATSSYPSTSSYPTTNSSPIQQNLVPNTSTPSTSNPTPGTPNTY